MQSLCTHITFILSLAAAQDVNTNISTSTLSPSVPSSISTYPSDHVSMPTNLTTTISPSSRNVTNLTTTTLPATTFHEGKFLSAQHSADLSQIELDWIQRREVVKDVFEMSIGGMIEAVDEVQKRGDSMMSGIKKQKEILAILKGEIREKKDTLAD